MTTKQSFYHHVYTDVNNAIHRIIQSRHYICNLSVSDFLVFESLVNCLDVMMPHLCEVDQWNASYWIDALAEYNKKE